MTPETLGLWGAVHKRLWDKVKDAAALDEAIRSYKRGFSLRNDYYNGINFAFLLNIRAHLSADNAKASVSSTEAARHLATAIADFVQAERVREEVLAICDEWLKSIPLPDQKASDEAQKQYLNSKYWVVATKAEAYLVQFYSGSQGKDQRLLWRATVKAPRLAYPEKEKPQTTSKPALFRQSPSYPRPSATADRKKPQQQ